MSMLRKWWFVDFFLASSPKLQKNDVEGRWAETQGERDWVSVSTKYFYLLSAQCREFLRTDFSCRTMVVAHVFAMLGPENRIPFYGRKVRRGRWLIRNETPFSNNWEAVTAKCCVNTWSTHNVTSLPL